MLYGPDGQLVSSNRFLEATENSGMRPSRATRVEGIRKSVSTSDWRTVVSLSRWIYANNGIAKGAICQRAMYTVGGAWLPNFRGEDKEWGEAARQWLIEDWFPNCEIRGGAYDFATCLQMDSIVTDRDGGYGVLLTKDDNGLPRTQRIPIHRFGAKWESREVEIEEGVFKGAKLHQGIISDRRGTPIGYRIYEDPINGEAPYNCCQDVPVSSLIHSFDPEWHDQGHGFPVLTHAVNELLDMMQSQRWEQLNMLVNSAHTIIEHNETGDDTPRLPVTGGGIVHEASKTGLSVETLEGGLYRYVKANSGQKLENLVNNRPGQDWESFQDRSARITLVGMPWPYRFWKSEGGGTDTRSDMSMAQLSVKDRQSLLMPVARRSVCYALSAAMLPESEGGLGILPPYKGRDIGGQFKWAFSLPPKMGIDDGREAKERRENIRAGLLTEEQDQSDRGDEWMRVRNQKEAEARDKLTRAKRLMDEFPITMETALAMLGQNNPNQKIAGKDDDEQL